MVADAGATLLPPFVASRVAPAARVRAGEELGAEPIGAGRTLLGRLGKTPHDDRLEIRQSAQRIPSRRAASSASITRRTRGTRRRSRWNAMNTAVDGRSASTERRTSPVTERTPA